MRFLLLFGLMGFGTSAQALEPTSSSLVIEVIMSVPSARRTEGSTAYLGIAQCEQMISASSEVSITFATNVDPTVESGSLKRFEGGYVFSVPRGSTTAVTCPSGCTTLNEMSNVTLTSELVRLRLPFTELIDVTSTEGCEGFDSEFFIRTSLRRNSADDTELVTSDARLVVDTVRPTPPSAVDVTVTEDRVEASWQLSDSTDVEQYGIYFSDTPFEGGITSNSTLGSRFVTAAGGRTSSSFLVSTPPGATVYIAMVAVDETGNESLMTAPIAAVAIETLDFWEQYKSSGGAEEGGCQSVGGSASLLAFGLLGMLGFRRRRLRPASALAGAALLALVAVPMEASAESDTHGTIEIKLGAMYPSIDNEVAGTPFQDVFGSGNLWYFELEAGFYFWQGFGKLGVAYHIGYSSVTGNALALDGTAVSDETTFGIMPNRGSLLYRFDVLATEFFIPFVPVGKVGLDYYLWWSEGPDGENSVVQGAEAFGGKWGWHASLGVQFLLDVIDPQSAALFDHNWGVNNSYLFGEYMMTQVDDFGGAGLDLSDNFWMFGLSFEY